MKSLANGKIRHIDTLQNDRNYHHEHTDSGKYTERSAKQSSFGGISVCLRFTLHQRTAAYQQTPNDQFPQTVRGNERHCGAHSPPTQPSAECQSTVSIVDSHQRQTESKQTGNYRDHVLGGQQTPAIEHINTPRSCFGVPTVFLLIRTHTRRGSKADLTNDRRRQQRRCRPKGNRSPYKTKVNNRRYNQPEQGDTDRNHRTISKPHHATFQQNAK